MRMKVSLRDAFDFQKPATESERFVGGPGVGSLMIQACFAKDVVGICFSFDFSLQGSKVPLSPMSMAPCGGVGIDLKAIWA